MLPLLDVETYNAIAQDNSDAGCSGIRRAKASFEDKNLALGVYYMLEGFQFRVPLLHRDTNLEKWHVDFKGIPFRSLRIQPTTDHGIVAMYAFGQKIGAFKILDFPARGPYVGDLVSRQRMIAWIWDYGNKRLEGRVKSKAAQRSQPKAPTKTHAKVRRTEKPLLHRVLHTASFKAQRGASSNIQGTRTVPKNGDITMEDVGAGAIERMWSLPLERHHFASLTQMLSWEWHGRQRAGDISGDSNT